MTSSDDDSSRLSSEKSTPDDPQDTVLQYSDSSDVEEELASFNPRVGAVKQLRRDTLMLEGDDEEEETPEEEKLPSLDGLSVNSTSDDDFFLKEEWRSQDLHVFVMSEAGKPIFSLHGDENKLAGLMGIMQAMVSYVTSKSNQLHQLIADDKRFVFLSRGSLLLVGVGKICDPTNHVMICLNYVYNQILFILTLRWMEARFARFHNLDLRSQLGDSERHFKAILGYVNESFGPMLGAVSCVALTTSFRDSIAQAINQSVKNRKKTSAKEDMVFALLFCRTKLVAFVRMKQQFLHPMDIHLLVSLISSSSSLRNAETNFMPICLPKFDANGYLYANISFLDENSCLILLTVDRTQFPALQEARNAVHTKLETLANCACYETLSAVGDVSLADVNLPEIRHFLFKYTLVAQYVTSEFAAPYANSRSGRDALASAYRRMHHQLHSTVPGLPATRQIVQTQQNETFLAWRESEFELFIALEPFTSRMNAVDVAKKLKDWIMSRKRRLFILSSPTF